MLVVEAIGTDQIKGKALSVKGPLALALDQAFTVYRDHFDPPLTITHIPLTTMDQTTRK